MLGTERKACGRRDGQGRSLVNVLQSFVEVSARIVGKILPV